MYYMTSLYNNRTSTTKSHTPFVPRIPGLEYHEHSVLIPADTQHQLKRMSLKINQENCWEK